MNLNEKWSDNITLANIDGNTSCPEELKVIWLYFTFYDCSYCVGISKKDIEEDFPSISMEGDTKLFDSFKSAMEDEYWPKLKEQFKRYQDYMIAEEKEWNQQFDN